MTTLEKFKLLATQCGVAPSPTRSPRASPVVQLRRQKTTLKMLFSRAGTRRLVESVEQSKFNFEPGLLAGCQKESDARRSSGSGRTLKDLFVSSPPHLETDEDEEGRSKGVVLGGSGLGSLIGGGPGSPRPVFMGLRFRSLMLRKAWRPVLDPIPE